MSRLFFCVLFGLLLFQSGGLITYFTIKARLSHKIGQARIENTNQHLEVLNLSLSEYSNALQSPNEIKWNGKMYDVKSICKNSDCVELVLMEDEEEGKWLRSLESIFSEEDEVPLPLKKLIQQISSLVYFSDYLDWNIIIPDQQVLYSAQIFLLPSNSFQEWFTPPELN